MREINEIIVHCSATKPGWMSGKSAQAKVNEIRRWHVEDNGWADIGYHKVIDISGAVIDGRPVEKAGAHTKGRNAKSIGVCLIGGWGAAATDQFEDHFTKEQDEALQLLLIDLQHQYGPGLMVSGHNQYAAKGCPGFSVRGWQEARTTFAAPKKEQPNLIKIIIDLIAKIINSLKGGK